MQHRLLEDDARDILAKAIFGLGLSVADLADRSGLPLPTVMAATGKSAYPAFTSIPDPAWLALAAATGLDGRALVAIVRGHYRPVLALPAWLACITTRQRMLEVNAWIAADPATGRAVIIDTGADARPLLGHLARNQWKAEVLLLTHDHPDHIACLADLVAAIPGLSVYSPAADFVTGTRVVPDTGIIETGAGRIHCLPTPGHTDGGTSYLIDSTSPSVCFVGDALFAGSIGGPRHSYPEALAAIRTHILPLPGDCVLCPGHGPATTVALESAHNPYFSSTP